MTNFLINPGTGSARDYGRVSIASARANMRKLLADAGMRRARVTGGKLDDDYDGRFAFTVSLGHHKVVVHMPGLKLALVRWMDDPGQNIWHFPRLYVDGSSWVWKYAVWSVHYELSGEGERERRTLMGEEWWAESQKRKASR